MNDKPFGYCDYHEANVLEEEFAWKGCWNCYHFSYSADFPYFDVHEAANTLKKSPSTIRRWLNEGHLHGKLFERGRRQFQLGSPRKWFISKASARLLKSRR